MKILCDSQNAIALAKNAVFHEKTKHMAIKYNFIRDLISQDYIKVVKISIAYNPADIFTKVFPVGKLRDALELLRVSRN